MPVRVPQLVTIIGLVGILQPYRAVEVVGSSMTPTFVPGAFLFADLRETEIRRGDIVVFEQNGERLIKRVALLENDVYATMKAGHEETTLQTVKAVRVSVKNGLDVRVRRVPNGTLFVLGDNPGQSTDSRHFGPVSKNRVVAILRDEKVMNAQWMAMSHELSSRLNPY